MLTSYPHDFEFKPTCPWLVSSSEQTSDDELQNPQGGEEPATPSRQ